MQDFVTLELFTKQARKAAEYIINCAGGADEVALYGVPRGGIPAAATVAACLEAAGQNAILISEPALADFIIDDIYDSGVTYNRYMKELPNTPFVVLFDKRKKEWKGKWLVMPYEVTDKGVDQSAEDIVIRLLQFIGEDPKREGLRETPARVLKAWKEKMSGYKIQVPDLLKTFEDGAEKANELVIVHGIEVVSCCEHHMADIRGKAHVGYIPNGRIVGLSKLARVVDAYARRLQVQERLTNQIADVLWTELKPLGVGVLIRAEHGCMSTRGVKLHGSVTTTSAMRGALMDEPETRSEFLQLCHMSEISK